VTPEDKLIKLLTDYMIDNKISGTKLSKKLGWPQCIFSRVINRKRKISLEEAFNIIKFLKINIEEIKP
jgi:hypothetical protein